MAFFQIFIARSWTSIRVMNSEQNRKLVERLAAFAPKKKVPFVECVKISKELDLTLEQVRIFTATFLSKALYFFKSIYQFSLFRMSVMVVTS